MGEIVVERSAAYDLLLSLDAIATPARYPRWRVWAERAAEEYGERELRRLRRWFGGKWPLGTAFQALIPLLPQPRGAAELMRGVAELPVADFLRVVVTSGYIDPETPLGAETLLALRRDPAAAQAFVDQYVRVSGQARGQMLRALADVEGARAELLAVLRRHTELPAYMRLEAETQDERERAARALEVYARAGAAGLPAWLAGNWRIEEFSPVVLAPSALLDGTLAHYIQEIARPLFDGTAYEPLIVVAGTRLALGEVAPEQRAAVMGGAASAGEAERAAAVFALFSDPSRLRLLGLLAERPRYGQELAAALGMSGATVSHHIAQLARAGVVGLERRAHRTYYALRREAVDELLRRGEGHLRALLAGPTEGAEGEPRGARDGGRARWRG